MVTDETKITSFFLNARRQELRELRLLQKEEQRAQQQLSNKLLQQREQMFRRFEQEMTVRFQFPAAFIFLGKLNIFCLVLCDETVYYDIPLE